MLQHPVRVFILDDSPQVTEMLSELFSDPGYVDIVGCHDSALTGTEEIRRLHPDVVILDLQLKDGSGFDVLKAIRLLPKAEEIVVILFTNHASRELHAHALKLGADFSLDKSQDHAKILGIIRDKVREREL